MGVILVPPVRYFDWFSLAGVGKVLMERRQYLIVLVLSIAAEWLIARWH